jgi:hypothetical protein
MVDDLGRIGRVWREADYEATDFETVVTDLLDGQYKNPVGIFAFNTAEGRSRDVSADTPPLRSATTRRAVGAAGLRRSPRSGRPLAALAAAAPGVTR